MDYLQYDLKYPYASEIPAPILELAASPSIQRLRDVGMNCGCEYTSFPIFARPGHYHRYEHSLGVALIVWHFTSDLKQAVAGLLHDIATPVFAHVIDFVQGDYIKQEATESATREIIEEDKDILSILDQYRLSVNDVCDYHLYPIADNDSPRLSADRLEYTLGNILHYGFDTYDTVDRIYRDLVILTAEDGMPEIGFRHDEAALEFAHLARRCSELYISPEDRYAMQRLAEIIRDELSEHILSEKNLYATEQQVIDILCSHPELKDKWSRFNHLHHVILSDSPDQLLSPRQVPAKKRCIDPLIKDQGRVSRIYPEYDQQLQAYLIEPQTAWIGEPLPMALHL